MAKICADVPSRTSSEDLPQQAKKTVLRLDRVRIPLGYGAVRGKSTSLIKNTAQEQISRYNREQGDAYDEKYFDDSPYWQKSINFMFNKRSKAMKREHSIQSNKG